MLAEVRHWIDKGDRSWNARQIAEEVARVYGLRRLTRQWRRLLQQPGLTYKRTHRNLKQ